MPDYSAPKKIDNAISRDNIDAIIDFPYEGEQIREKYGLDANPDTNEYQMIYDPDEEI